MSLKQPKKANLEVVTEVNLGVAIFGSVFRQHTYWGSSKHLDIQFIVSQRHFHFINLFDLGFKEVFLLAMVSEGFSALSEMMDLSVEPRFKYL